MAHNVDYILQSIKGLGNVMLSKVESDHPGNEPRLLSLGDVPRAADVIVRMMEALGVDSDQKLADCFGLSKATISAWRNRNKIPYEECLRIAMSGHESFEYLITGKGMNEYNSPGGFFIQRDLLSLLLTYRYDFLVAADQKVVESDMQTIADRADVAARRIINLYARLLRVLDEAGKQGLDRESVIAGLKSGFDLMIPLE